MMPEITEEAELRDIAVVGISARSGPFDVDAAFAAGTRDFLQKLYSIHDLKNPLTRHLAHWPQLPDFPVCL